MKNCLITGGGSKFGKKITEQLVQAGYHVYLITGSQQVTDPNITVISVDWHELKLQDIRGIISNLPNLDLIFFNHNASALTQAKFNQNQIQNFKDWQQSYFVASQFPFYLIQRSDISSCNKWIFSFFFSNIFFVVACS
jgi:nucleoside-diphosphate-sugar epimerase